VGEREQERGRGWDRESGKGRVREERGRLET